MSRGIDFEPADTGGTSYTDEEAQDAVGTIFQSSSTVAVVYTDATPTIIPHVIPGSLSAAALSFDVATQTELDAHINDSSAAHAASAISADSTTLVGTGTDVQAVLEELDNSIVDHAAAADPHAGYVLESLFDANTVIAATSDDTPTARTISEEQVVGRITGGAIAGINPSSVAQQINTQTGSTYTVVIGDAGKIVEMTTATVNTVVIPTNASVAFPVGTRIDLVQYGTGQLRVATTSVVTTIYSARTVFTLATSKAFATIYQRATNEWLLGGDLG